MKEKIIAKRYAEGFLQEAKTSIGFEQGLKELLDIKTLLRENPDFRDFIENRGVAYTKKCDIIEAVLKDSFSASLRNFLKLLIEKERIEQLMDIIDYSRIAYAHGEALDALITTTYPLDLDVIVNIKQTFEKKINRKLNLYVELDPNLLGGVKVMIGHIIYDGSLRGKLQKMQEELKELKIR